MVAVPPGIICVNDDISPSVKEHLVRQLFINHVMDGYSFDTYIGEDPTFPDKIKQLNQRILVIRSFIGRENISSWTIPDVVIYVKNGLAYIEENKFGPPGLALPVLKVYWGALGVYGW